MLQQFKQGVFVLLAASACAKLDENIITTHAEGLKSTGENATGNISTEGTGAKKIRSKVRGVSFIM